MRGIRPDAYYVSVLDIDPDVLVKRGYRAVLLDLDNTLQPRGTSELSPEAIAWVQSLRDAGLGVALVSNSMRERAVRAAQALDAPLVRNARKPFAGGYVRACAMLGVSCDQAVMIGDQSYTDVLGAHRVGMDAILVMPQSGSDPLHTHFLRMLDRRSVRGMRAIGSDS
ncbi:MAG: YqeG family HAD IIIA-type phosphatase [Coriobacteriales bacterium]